MLPKVRAAPNGTSSRTVSRYMGLHRPGVQAHWNKIGVRPGAQPQAERANVSCCRGPCACARRTSAPSTVPSAAIRRSRAPPCRHSHRRRPRADRAAGRLPRYWVHIGAFDRQCLAAHPPGEAPPLVARRRADPSPGRRHGFAPRTPPTTLRKPPLEPEALTISLSWAEAIAEALACVPDQVSRTVTDKSARHGEPRSESRSRLRASATSSTRCDALSTQRFPDTTRGRSMECSPRFGQIDPLRTNSRPRVAVFCGRRWNNAGPASSSSAPTPADVRAGRTPYRVAALKCSFLSPATAGRAAGRPGRARRDLRSTAASRRPGSSCSAAGRGSGASSS